MNDSDATTGYHVTEPRGRFISGGPRGARPNPSPLRFGVAAGELPCRGHGRRGQDGSLYGHAGSETGKDVPTTFADRQLPFPEVSQSRSAPGRSSTRGSGSLPFCLAQLERTCPPSGSKLDRASYLPHGYLIHHVTRFPPRTKPESVRRRGGFAPVRGGGLPGRSLRSRPEARMRRSSSRESRTA